MSGLTTKSQNCEFDLVTVGLAFVCSILGWPHNVRMTLENLTAVMKGEGLRGLESVCTA